MFSKIAIVSFVITATFLVCLDLSIEVLPADTAEKLKVYVAVTIEDENTKAFIESHIKRELRSLQDVAIVGFADAQYEVRIVAIEQVSKSTGRKLGNIAVSYNFLTKHYFADNAYYEPILGIQAGMTDDLDKLCKSIITKFDVQILEPARALSSLFDDVLTK